MDSKSASSRKTALIHRIRSMPAQRFCHTKLTDGMSQMPHKLPDADCQICSYELLGDKVVGLVANDLVWDMYPDLTVSSIAVNAMIIPLL